MNTPKDNLPRWSHASNLGEVRTYNPDRLTIMTLPFGTPNVITGGGIEIWALFDGENTMEEIIRLISQRHELCPKNVTDQVQNFAIQLAKLKLIVLKSDENQ